MELLSQVMWALVWLGFGVVIGGCVVTALVVRVMRAGNAVDLGAWVVDRAANLKERPQRLGGSGVGVWSGADKTRQVGH